MAKSVVKIKTRTLLEALGVKPEFGIDGVKARNPGHVGLPGGNNSSKGNVVIRGGTVELHDVPYWQGKGHESYLLAVQVGGQNRLVIVKKFDSPKLLAERVKLARTYEPAMGRAGVRLVSLAVEDNHTAAHAFVDGDKLPRSEIKRLLAKVDLNNELPEEHGHFRLTPTGHRYWLPY